MRRRVSGKEPSFRLSLGFRVLGSFFGVAGGGGGVWVFGEFWACRVYLRFGVLVLDQEVGLV